MKATVTDWLRQLRAAVHRTRLRLSARRVGVVLLYHGVSPKGGDARTRVAAPIAVAVLERQVRHLLRHYRVVAPTEIMDSVRMRRRFSRIPVALTFDDDLASHAAVTAPLLSRLGAPATFFLSGRSLEQPWRFWWEDLEAAIDAGVLAPSAVATLPMDAVRKAAAREPWAASSLAGLIEELDPPTRADVAQQLRELVGAPDQRAGIRAGSVRRLSESGFEVGFHTFRHDRLTGLDDVHLAEAMSEGREGLEACLAHPLHTISYPHGRADSRVARAARDAGFRLGFSGGDVAVTPESDPLLIPRVGTFAGTEGAFAGYVVKAAKRT